LNVNTDHAMRPQRLDDYVGQDAAAAQLRIRIAAARSRKEPLPHVLLSGPPGLGKTTLAHVIANEMGATAHCVMATSIETPQDAAELMTKMNERDVLFIDEIHRLPVLVGESIYAAMEDFRTELKFRCKRTQAAVVVPFVIPPFTLIGATTQPGLLEQPLRERFGVALALQFYDVPTLKSIIACNAKRLGTHISVVGADIIARRARGTPRVANHMLRFARDIAEAAQSNGQGIIAKHVADALELLGIDDIGLNANDRQYLKVLQETYNGGPAGAAALAATLGVKMDTVSGVIEPYLLQQGLIARTQRGRVLTPLGEAHLAGKVGVA
jgi:Holliday junction DNA helicase RuvB